MQKTKLQTNPKLINSRKPTKTLIQFPLVVRKIMDVCECNRTQNNIEINSFCLVTDIKEVSKSIKKSEKEKVSDHCGLNLGFK